MRSGFRINHNLIDSTEALELLARLLNEVVGGFVVHLLARKKTPLIEYPGRLGAPSTSGRYNQPETAISCYGKLMKSLSV